MTLKTFHITFTTPGQSRPHTTIRAKQHYRRGDVAPTGGTFEVLLGGFGGQAALKFNRPFMFKARDRVRVFLRGDPHDNPTYLGEASGEPWEGGEGVVNCIPLKENVAKSAWWGKLEAAFKPFHQQIINWSELAADISVGDIPESAIVLRHNTPFELLGDTLNATLPNLPGAVWGITSQGRLGIHVPVPEVTHRFNEYTASMAPGDSSGLANAIRFPYHLPNGDESFYNHRLPLDQGGAIWDVTQAPSTVALPPAYPLLGQNATVTTRIGVGSQDVNLDVTKPAFDPAWAGVLAEATPELRLGTNQAITSADQSKVKLSGVAVRYRYNGTPHTFRAVIALDASNRRYFPSLQAGSFTTTQYSGTVLETRSQHPTTGAWSEWSVLKPAITDQTNTRVLRNDDLNSSAFNPTYPPEHLNTNTDTITIEIRYAQGFIDAWNAANPTTPLPGFAVMNTAILQDNPGGAGGAWFGEGASVAHTAQVGGLNVELETQIKLYGGRSTTGDYDPWTFENSARKIKDNTVPVTEAVVVALNAPVTLQSGAAVTVLGTAESSAVVTAITSTGDRVILTALDADPANPTTLRYGYRGADISVVAFELVGTLNNLGRLGVEVADLSALVAYGDGLLYSRQDLVREWFAEYGDLTHRDGTRLKAYGVVHFFHPVLGDVFLAFQKLTYDLDAWTARVSAGTAQASSEEDAVISRFQSIEFQIRKAGER